MNVYKITDIIKFEFLKIPKTLFANPKYKVLSSDAKLTYSLLYDRLSLSKQNNWMNERNEVYLIFTREEIADELGISYKKSISAFRELTDAELIYEKRCGRGLPNRIFIAKPELSVTAACKYSENENSRTPESAPLINDLSYLDARLPTITQNPEVPFQHILNCQIDIPRKAVPEYQELPNWHTIKTNLNHTDPNHIYFSQSFSQYEKNQILMTGQTDEILILETIIANCQLKYFDEEVQKIFYDAIERLFFCDSFKIGNAILPREKVRSRLNELDHSVLETALYKLHQNRDRPIRNITAYVMSTIFNCITEEYSLLHVDPYLNSLRG